MFDTVVGLEVHVQLSTKSKLFCGCDTQYTDVPNVNICSVCAGHLGALPVLNEKALDYAIMVGLALGCKINKFSMFDRKNYFYPDLPKGYQISQFYHPYAEKGYLDIKGKRVGITRIHIEEDAGKLIHNNVKGESYVDMNRCSVPLIEIVTEPDISSAEEAQEFLNKLRTIIKYTEASDVSMELGSLRCDANVSVKRNNSRELGTRVEIKNLNSFKSVAKSIDYEVKRQTETIKNGGEIVCETRLWDEDKMETRSMRQKDSEQDYRYFPEPDLLPIEIEAERMERISKEIPELPDAKIERFVKEYGIPQYDAEILVSDKYLAKYFEEVVSHSYNAKSSSNWIMTEVLRGSGFPISSANLGKMIKMIDDNIISGKIAKDLFKIMLEDKRDPMEIIEEKGMLQISDESMIEKIVDDVLTENPDSVKEYRAGRDRVLGFLVGQVIKESKGKANPQLVNRIILSKIKEE